jgi:hypothetical protein
VFGAWHGASNLIYSFCFEISVFTCFTHQQVFIGLYEYNHVNAFWCESRPLTNVIHDEQLIAQSFPPILDGSYLFLMGTNDTWTFTLD